MNFQSSRRRGEEGVAMVIDFLLSNARLVLGVGGAAMLGIATLVVKRVSGFARFVYIVGSTQWVTAWSAICEYGTYIWTGKQILKCNFSCLLSMSIITDAPFY